MSNVLTVIVMCKVIIKVYPWLQEEKAFSVIPTEIEIEGPPEDVNKRLEYYDRNYKVGHARVVYCSGELHSL
jgi:hypothetical protein